MLPSFFDSVLQLIIRTSTDLPPDVRAAMKIARGSEPEGTRSSQALTIIAQNIDLAADGEGAICQDTGMPTFDVRVPVGANQIWMRRQIREAVAEATRRGKLRPNSVDSITGQNSGDNLGPGTPIIHFDQWEERDIEVKLILKGGGCENTNAQYALPTELDHLGRADRSLEGVRKCILHAVWKAQGKGCSPGAVGVCVGGDRTSGYLHAKEQLFRTLDDVNPDERLARIEAAVMEQANQLTVGPMGFGGQTSLIGCKIGALNRLPASFFVSVAYDCWPLVVKDANESGGWRVTAAGPTTSIREEPYQADIIERYGVRAVMGKGGMGGRTLAGLAKSGAVYLNAVGGAAQFYARCIERVSGVSLLEFGTPEAMWHLEVRDFPAIVTMDSHGNSLHKDVEADSGRVLETLRG